MWLVKETLNLFENGRIQKEKASTSYSMRFLVSCHDQNLLNKKIMILNVILIPFSISLIIRMLC